MPEQAPQKIQSKKVWTSHWWKLRPREPKDVHLSMQVCQTLGPKQPPVHCKTSTIPPTSWRCRFSRSVSALIHWISPFIVLMDFKTNEYRYRGSDDRTENSWGHCRDDIQVGVVLNSFEVLPKNSRKSML